MKYFQLLPLRHPLAGRSLTVAQDVGLSYAFQALPRRLTAPPRLMSDYEVTLVNDNSAIYLPPSPTMIPLR